MFWNLLALTCESNIQIVKPNGYGPLGTFDIEYKGKSLSKYDGTFVNLIVNGEKKQLDFNEKITNNGLEAKFSYEITDDIVKIIYTINNPTNQPINYKLGAYSNVDFDKGFFDSKDKVFPLTEKSFYIEEHDDADYKFVYLLMSKDGYNGPDDYYYGNFYAIENSADKYFLKFDNYNPAPTISNGVDILVSYSWKERVLAANSQEVLALKLGFTKTPKISKNQQDKTQYSSSDSISLTIKVDDDKFGKVYFDCDGVTIKTEDYTANGQETPITANIPVPSTATYESGEKQLSIYVIDELSIKSNIETFTFTVKNKPSLMDFKLNPKNVISGQKVHIQGDINDIDKTKKVYAYFKFDDNGEKQKILEFESDGTTHKVDFEVTVPNYDSIGKKSFKVWASEVENSEMPDDAKTVEFEVITKPTVELQEPAKRIYSRTEAIEIKGKITATTDVTLKFYIDGVLQEGSIESVKKGVLLQGFKITDKIGFGKHKIFVTVVDGNGIESDPSNEYEFQVNNGPELFDVKKSPESVKIGQDITITGYVEDVDSGDEVTIIAMIGTIEGGRTTVRSEGNRKEFKITIKTSDKNGSGWKLISVSAIDKQGKKSSVKELSIQILANSPINNPDDNKSNGPGKSTRPEDNAKMNKVIIPVSVSLGVILVIALVVVIVFVMIKKKNSNTDIVSDNEAYMNNDP